MTSATPMSILASGKRPSHTVNLSSENFEQHLRREVEVRFCDGNVTWHDFERTKRFASSSRTFYTLTLATGTATSGWSVYYSRWYRRRPWSWTATLMLAPITFIAGIIPGMYYQGIRVKRFQEGLEDQRALSKALGRFLRHQHTDVEGNSSVKDAEADNSISDKPGMGKQNRWAELRNVSVPAADSTWDKIRQSHEWSEATSVPTPGTEAADGRPVDDRQTEQAKFDALLEAERKMSS